MKFKKADTTLRNVIKELVNSEQYYADGDLGLRKASDGTLQLIDGNHEGDVTYFCNSIADVTSTKSVNCSTAHNVFVYYSTDPRYMYGGNALETLDDSCRIYADKVHDEIVFSDGTTFYQTCPDYLFGKTGAFMNGYNPGHLPLRAFKDFKDENGLIPLYKPVCIDIDGTPENATRDDCVNECPFGYGIRYDGKIITGVRANTWLAKDFNGKDGS